MSKKTILVVEDDVDLLQQLKLYLEKKDYEVIDFETEKEATEVIAKGGFDLAILDIILENKDSGIVLTHKIKKQNPELPVIIVTGVTRETGICVGCCSVDEKKWIKADALLTKDFRFEQLDFEMEKLLK
jgi:DNA-binding NtrC family response regulator